jgi:UDP-glucose 4-epimerase
VHIIDSLVTGEAREPSREGDVPRARHPRPKAAELIASTKPDVLAHLAAQMDVRRSVEDPVYDASVNILGSLNLLEAVRTKSPGTRVVFASTGGALYGDNTTPPNFEEFKKDPESPYAVSKLTVEHYFGYYGRVHKLDCVAMRFGNVYGPRQDPHGEAGVVAIFCGRILQGKPLTIFGDGLQTRDYVYVGDVAEAMWYGATKQLATGGPSRCARVQRRHGDRHVGDRHGQHPARGSRHEGAPRVRAQASGRGPGVVRRHREGWPSARMEAARDAARGTRSELRWAADRNAATAGTHA